MESARVAESEAVALETLDRDPKATLLVKLGEAYHQAGVVSDQLEDLMNVTARALGLTFQVAASPTSITAAIGTGTDQRVVFLRLEPGVIDLRRLALLNDVFEAVVHRRTSVSAALSDVEHISTLRHAAPWPLAIAASVALSAGVGYLLGGHSHEVAASAIIGLAVGVLSILARRSPTTARLFEVLAAFLATTITAAYAAFVHPLSAYVTIVAGVVQPLPGLQLTQALHELAYRNLVAGTARLGSVLITLLSLGCGFALGVAIVGPGQMHVTEIAASGASWYGIALAVVGVALAIAVLENARYSHVWLVLASCAIAELAYRVFAATPGHQVATFGAALVVGLVTSLGARLAKLPQAVLLVPGLLILVPGSLSYESILLVVQSGGGGGDALSIAINSVFAAIEIVAGLLLAQLFVAPAHAHDRPLEP